MEPYRSPSETSTPVPEPEPASRGPWGLGATLGFSALVLIVFFVAQSVAGLGALVFETGTLAISPQDAKDLEGNGLVISAATLGAFVVCIPLILLLVLLRRGPSPREYLALRMPSWKGAAMWTVIFILLIAGVEVMNVLLDKPAVPEFMKSAYASVPHPIWLFLAVAIAAPIFEEVFFRGFLLPGLALSRLGDMGAILISSIVWAIIHVQYGWYEISIIFVMGIVLGLARLRTKSLWTPIALHALNNTIAMIQTAVLAAKAAN